MARKKKKQDSSLNNFADMKKQIVSEIWSVIGDKMNDMMAKVLETVSKNGNIHQNKGNGTLGEITVSKEGVEDMIDHTDAIENEHFQPDHGLLPTCSQSSDPRPPQLQDEFGQGQFESNASCASRFKEEYTETCQNHLRHEQSTQVLANSQLQRPSGEYTETCQNQQSTQVLAKHFLPAFDPEFAYFPLPDDAGSVDVYSEHFASEIHPVGCQNDFKFTNFARKCEKRNQARPMTSSAPAGNPQRDSRNLPLYGSFFQSKTQNYDGQNVTSFPNGRKDSPSHRNYVLNGRNYDVQDVTLCANSWNHFTSHRDGFSDTRSFPNLRNDSASYRNDVNGQNYDGDGSPGPRSFPDTGNCPSKDLHGFVNIPATGAVKYWASALSLVNGWEYSEDESRDGASIQTNHPSLQSCVQYKEADVPQFSNINYLAVDWGTSTPYKNSAIQDDMNPIYFAQTTVCELYQPGIIPIRTVKELMYHSRSKQNLQIPGIDGYKFKELAPICTQTRRQ